MPFIFSGKFVLTVPSHATKGSTTGCFYGERRQSLAELEAANIPTELASFGGGKTPIDDLNLEDQVNASIGMTNPSVKHVVKPDAWPM